MIWVLSNLVLKHFHRGALDKPILLIWGDWVDVDDIIRLILLRAFNTDVLHLDLKLRPYHLVVGVQHLISSFLKATVCWQLFASLFWVTSLIWQRKIGILVPRLLIFTILRSQSIHTLVKRLIIIFYEYLLRRLWRLEALVLSTRRVSAVLAAGIAFLFDLWVYDWLGIVPTGWMGAWGCSHQQEVSDQVIATLDLNHTGILNILRFLTLHRVEPCCKVILGWFELLVVCGRDLLVAGVLSTILRKW